MKRENEMRNTVFVAVLSIASVGLAATSFVREKTGSIWQDGLLVGDGTAAAEWSAPDGEKYGLVWNDTFDVDYVRFYQRKAK